MHPALQLTSAKKNYKQTEMGKLTNNYQETASLALFSSAYFVLQTLFTRSIIYYKCMGWFDDVTLEYAHVNITQNDSANFSV